MNSEVNTINETHPLHQVEISVLHVSKLHMSFPKIFEQKEYPGSRTEQGRVFEKYYPRIKNYIYSRTQKAYRKRSKRTPAKVPNVSYEIKDFETSNTDSKEVALLVATTCREVRSGSGEDDISAIRDAGDVLLDSNQQGCSRRQVDQEQVEHASRDPG